jgi:hypothetical protein
MLPFSKWYSTGGSNEARQTQRGNRNIAIDQGFLITSNSDATQTQLGDNNNASVIQHGW